MKRYCAYDNNGDLLRGGEHIELPYNPEEMYGIKVAQDIRTAMYIYVVVFNAADLKIQVLVSSPTFLSLIFLQILCSSKNTVNDGEPHRIGWGAGGGDPIYLSIADHLEQETMYFKVIVASQKQDLSVMERGSILSDATGDRPMRREPAPSVDRPLLVRSRVKGVTLKRPVC